MQRFALLVMAGFLALISVTSGHLNAPTAEAAQRGKTVVLIGESGLDLGETPWQRLRQQFGLRQFPQDKILEWQYAGGQFGPDGSWTPNPGGTCESYSLQSFQLFRQFMGELAQARPNDEVFLIGYGTGGFVATQALFLAASGQDDPEIWKNLSGIASISGPMAGLSEPRTALVGIYAGEKDCVDLTMLAWMKEVGEDPDRYVKVEERAAGVQQLGYKVGSFGNTIDCYYRYVRDVCPKVAERVGRRDILLNFLGDERLTQFAKTGTIWKEYNIAMPIEEEPVDNHVALLISTQPMAEVAEYVLSQTREI